MSDKHFAELVKELKQNSGYVKWSVIAHWYNKHYVTVNVEQAHRYVRVIMQLVVQYAENNGLMTMTQLVERLSPNFSELKQKFTDLTDDKNSQIEYRILAEVCGKLILTRIDAIPYYEEIL